MNSYSERLTRAEHYLGQGEFELCTMLCGKAMELLLKDILERYLSFADERQSAEVRGFLSVHRKPSWEKLTAGEIVTLCLRIKVLESLAKKIGLDLEAIALLNLREMVDLRNKATHTEVHDEIQEKADAYVMYGSLLRLSGLAKSLLLETERGDKDTIRGTITPPVSPAIATRTLDVFKNHIAKTVPRLTKKLTLLRNKASGKHFIYLEDESSNKMLLVTPDGLIKGLDVNLFDEPTDMEEVPAIDQQLVSKEQVRKHHDYVVERVVPDRDRFQSQRSYSGYKKSQDFPPSAPWTGRI